MKYIIILSLLCSFIGNAYSSEKGIYTTLECFVSYQCFGTTMKRDMAKSISEEFLMNVVTQDDLNEKVEQLRVIIAGTNENDIHVSNLLALELELNSQISVHNKEVKTKQIKFTVAGTALGAIIGYGAARHLKIFSSPAYRGGNPAGHILSKFFGAGQSVLGVALVAGTSTIGAGIGQVTGRVLSDEELDKVIDSLYD